MNEVFDRALPSPIRFVLELRSSAEGSVVSAGGASAAQRAIYLRSSLEDRLIEHLRGDDRREMVIVTGSAGGGKSAAIDLLLREGVVDRADVVEDATHAESPREDQVDRLSVFFAPFADGTAARAGAPPKVIALNTGMAIRFFDQARDRGFSELERLFKARVGLGPTSHVPALDARVLVLNLDERPTTGGEGSLFRRMLAAFDPALPDGVLRGAERCRTCAVRSYCFVRTNAAIVSSTAATESLDGLVKQVALERGRDLPPRALWDLATDLVTGGEPFAQSDPCDRIAELAAADDSPAVWRRLVCNSLFTTGHDAPSRFGTLAIQMRMHDPSLLPTRDAHHILASAGVQPEDDARRLSEWFAVPTAEAVTTAAAALASVEGIQPSPGRGLVRASYIAGSIKAIDDLESEFAAALAEYAEYVPGAGNFPALTHLRDLAARGLVRGFGAVARGEDFLPADTRATSRDVRLFVHADLRDHAVLDVDPDPVLQADPLGAWILSYRPLRIVLLVRRAHHVPVTLPAFRLLAALARGVAHAGTEAERFEAMRRVIERAAPSGTDAALLIALADGERFKLARRPVLGGRVVRVLEEVS
jgi:hypothetical protein